MSTITYGVPAAVQQQLASQWRGLRVRWIGYDGTTWDLTDWASGVFLYAAGVRGFNQPKYQIFRAESGALDGSRRRGSRALAREQFWPIMVSDTETSQGFIDRDSAFWETMEPDLPGVLEVEQPGGEVRSMRLAYLDDGDHELPEDPVLAGMAVYGIKMEADEPLWRGRPIVQRWVAGVLVDFSDPTGSPNVFHISEGSTLSNAIMPNPGQARAWVEYMVFGPTTSLDIGPGTRLVEIPFAVAADRVLVVDSAERTAVEVDAPPTGPGGAALPDEQQVAFVRAQVDAGTYVDRTVELGGGTRWASVPRRGQTTITANMVGTGTVRAELVPLYRRPW